MKQYSILNIWQQVIFLLDRIVTLTENPL